MLRRNLNNRFNHRSDAVKHRGFTLVELIVVLAIVAILAVAGVATAVGYINKSRYEKNTQNAISIYQAAQEALSQKVSNGTIDTWVRELIEIKKANGDLDQNSITNFESDLDQDNESKHMTISLTYNPNSDSSVEDQFLYDLLVGYFYDKTIFFNGTMSLELDVVGTYGNERINYSASAVTAFFCEQNKSSSGWDGDCVNQKQGGTTDGLPWRDPDYRYHTSHVGMFDGTISSTKGPDGVLPVFLPQAVSQELYGHTIADSTDTGYLFNLRNGETLDVAWAIFDNDGTANKFHNEDIKITLHTPNDSKYNNSESYSDVELSISKNNLQAFLNSVSNDQTVVYENINNSLFNITRTSQEGLVDVDVKIGSNSKGTWKFPLTVTKVMGDGREECPNPNVGYYEFRLSLDCMMVRADEYSFTGANASKRYNAERLFGNTPRNIYATLDASFTYKLENGTDDQKTVADVKAARAIDDPVYFTEVKKFNGDQGRTSYCYFIQEGAAALDEDDSEDATGHITGLCVVNTLFGDYKYNDSVAGTSWTSSGGDAVITAFRHLYNIRMIQSGTVNYRIVKDLDWYVRKSGMRAVSEVKVFMSDQSSNRGNAGYTNARFRTPATYESNDIFIVSFPALNELKAGQTLTSMSKDGGEIFSINNVQLRAASFYKSKDTGYGLVCKNSGTIFNVYTNNLNLVLTNVKDGSSSDYKSICPNNAVELDYSASNPLNTNPVGGLVGVNVNAIGLQDQNVEDNCNTIRMSNCIVMSGSYWNSNTGINVVGGVIGEFLTSGSLGGVIKIDGSFAVVSGGKNTAGILGNCHTDVGARLVVDGDSANDMISEFTLPQSAITNEDMKCVIAGRGNIGGAIAWFESGELTYTPETTLDCNTLTYDSETGKLSFPDMNDSDFQIDINLPEGALIVKNGSYDTSNPSRPIGGAIGRWTLAQGEYASIRVRNNGDIIATTGSQNVHCGGAVGREDNSSVSTVYIEIYNGEKSNLGSLNSGIGSVATGGAYGRIEGNKTGNIAINAVNEGIIRSRGNDNGQGTGGAIGGIYDKVQTTYYINVLNSSNSQIIGAGNDSSKACGTGGVIGGMYCNNTTYIPSASVLYAENHGYISGIEHVGGNIGFAAINYGSIYAVNYAPGGSHSESISGDDYVGGTVGREMYSHTGMIQAILKVGTRISGDSYVGGSAGEIESFDQTTGVARTVVKGSSTVYGTGSYIGGVCGGIWVSGNPGNGLVELSGDSSIHTLTVTGEESNVGGVAGLVLSSTTNNIIVKAPEQSGSDWLKLLIDGNDDVGGAIGELENGSKDNNISINIKLCSGSHIVAAGGNNAGGAIGNLSATGGSFRGKINVGTAWTSSDQTYVSAAGSCVGGAVGHFGTISLRQPNSDFGISVNFNNDSCSISSGVSSSNDANVGGAVGYFEGAADGGTGVDNSEFPIEVYLGDSIVSSEGANVGGAIGKNMIKNGIITVAMSGSIIGSEKVGGAVGYNLSDINSISTTISGEVTSQDSDGDYVGGAIGLNERSVKSVSATINPGAHITGSDYVGGAIGRIGSESNTNAVSVNSVNVTIDSNNGVAGRSNIGGAVGKVGSGTVAHSIGNVNVIIKPQTGTPVVQNASLSSSEEACIGGVIGKITSGSVTSIGLSGSGGNVNPQSANAEAPNTNISNAILISGSGKSLGGVIGQLGESSVEISVKNITVTGVNLAVVSKNGSQNVGGWIGACYSKCKLGTSTSNLSNYNINTVKVVFSKDECVGGFIGLACAPDTSNRINVYAKINMSLNSAYITGLARVGGLYGDSDGVNHYSKCIINIEDGTIIGDFSENPNAHFCIEAGGFAGRVSDKSVFIGGQKVPDQVCDITIYIDYLSAEKYSKIYAGGKVSTPGCSVSIDDAGVGGAIGRLGTKNGGDFPKSLTNTDAETYSYIVKTFGVISPSSSPTVYSSRVHAGGAIGHMMSGTISRCFSTACVKQTGSGCTGGFVGKMDAGSLANSYAGGHTFGGQYVPDEENIVGTTCVGGFAGYLGNIKLVYQNYSTSSVRGDDYLGGFVGKTSDTIGKDKLQYCYCTGLVSAPDSLYVNNFVPNDGSVCVGSFAGYLPNVNVCSSGDKSGRALMYINTYSGIGRVGNIPESSFYDGVFTDSADPNVQDGVTGRNGNSNRVLLARWGDWGINWYIRHRKESVYVAEPFDDFLEQNTDNYFPLRTFISYKIKVNGKDAWKGEHWGDWPVFPEGKEQLYDTDINLSILSYSYNDSALVNNEISNNLKVYSNGEPLKEGRDYVVKYPESYKAGTSATVVITGLENYYGTFRRTITIVPANIEDAQKFNISVPESVTFDIANNIVTPEVTITYGSITLKKDTDYTLSYENNTQPGTDAKVIIQGINNYTGTVTKTFTIKAAYLVEFDTKGGSDVPSQVVEEGKFIVRPDNPTKTGHDFVYWCSDEECETEYTFNTAVSSDMTLYAKWSPVKYTVEFITGEGATQIASIEAEYGSYIERPADPVRDGYTFMYWYVEDDQGNQTEYDFENTVVEGPVTLIAQWHKNWTVTFDSCGGSDVPAQSVEYNKAATRPDDPTREDYTFMYWYKDDIDSEYDFDEIVTDDITLYAKWEKKPTITFDYGYDSKVETTKIDYGSTVDEPTPDIRDHYRFDGWYEDLDSDEEFDFTQPIYSDTVLYAKWTRVVIVEFVTFDGDTQISPNPMEITYGTTLRELDIDPVRDGYEFVGWYVDSLLENGFDIDTPIKNDYTLYAKWNKKPTVTFDYEYDDRVETVTIGYNSTVSEPAKPTRDGIKFAGWYEDLSSDEAFDFDTALTADIVLHAKWTVTVEFFTYEGDTNTYPPIEALYGSTLQDLNLVPPVRDGYEFKGWYVDSDCKNEFTGTFTENILLYAKWEKKP